ncbi:hypothetical protein [Psychrobacillus sp. NPDC093180]|uniref:hypothetical protein n=1 Tax=Psychrobacillus sp. NPDC093180 TaxID=3364489 RepID=UPI00382F6974
MSKIMFLALSLALTSVILLGCQSEDRTTIDTDKTNTEQQSENNGKLKFDGEITKVSISKSKGSSATIFEDDGSIETFKSMISSAVKENGIAEMAKPEFYVDVIYENENKQSFYLWIGEKGEKSTLMKTDDTHTIYTVSEEMTNKLIDLID